MVTATLVDDLDTEVVEDILVVLAVHLHVDSSVLLGYLEVPLSEDMVLAFLERHEIASVLLRQVALLLGKVVLLRKD